MFRSFAAMAALALFVAPALGAGEAPPQPDNIRRIPNATVVKFENNKLEVLAADGKEKVAVAFNADTKILRNRSGTTADLKAGVFVGCTAVEGADHKLRATEIRVFPDALRGIGEGHYPWPVDNPEPMTTMTNGNVEMVSGVTDGHVIKVSYKGGVTEIEIPASVTIMVTEIVGTDTLKPGAKVSVSATVNSDGSLTARFVRINV